MEINPQTVIQDIVAVRRLRTILWFELSSPVLFFLLYILGFLLLYLVILAAAIFTPYILYILIREKRYGWITIFFFMVILPYIFIFMMFLGYILFSAWLLLPIIMIYLYFFLLKYSVDDWLQEFNAHEQLEEQKKELEQKREIELL